MAPQTIHFWQWVIIAIGVVDVAWVTWLLYDFYRVRRGPQPVTPAQDPTPKPQSPTGPSEAIYQPHVEPVMTIYRDGRGLRLSRR